MSGPLWPTGGSLAASLPSMITRAERFQVRYAQIHSLITMMRLRNPIKKNRCTAHQTIHAGNPENVNDPMRHTAAERPIVASSPLSR
jgi:hypothetical protein